MHIYYLHGFASSARSKKAEYFGARLRAHGVALRCPDFNEPAFATLTLTRMLDQLAADLATFDGEKVVLIGSSLGGAVAIHTAARLPHRVDRLVLLAPALEFPRNAGQVLGADRLQAWREGGTLEVFHYARGAAEPLNYTFCEDGLRYDAMTAAVSQPTMIFQGLRDDVVDYRMVERFAAVRPNVSLTLFDDDHQLMASLPAMWTGLSAFLGLA
jgi:pimeloyl-ACP methyl ester carboxylesterase